LKIVAKVLQIVEKNNIFVTNNIFMEKHHSQSPKRGINSFFDQISDKLFGGSHHHRQHHNHSSDDDYVTLISGSSTQVSASDKDYNSQSSYHRSHGKGHHKRGFWTTLFKLKKKHRSDDDYNTYLSGKSEPFMASAKDDNYQSHGKGHHKRSFWAKLFKLRRKHHKEKELQNKWQLADEPVKKEKFKIISYINYAVNSTMLYIAAYMVAFFTYQFAVIFIASHYDIDSVLYYYEVYFPCGNSSPLWSRFNIILITLAGPMISIIMGTIYHRIVLKRISKPTNKLFVLWLTFHSINMFFGAFVAGIITDQGFGYVADWMYMHVAFKFMFAIIAIFILAILGFYTARYFLETATSVYRIKSKNRLAFFIAQGIVPWLVGGLILYTIKYPTILPQHVNILVYDTIILGTLIFMVIPIIFNTKAKPKIIDKYSRSKRGINWIMVAAVVLLLVLFRWGLSGGLHFVIKFVVSITPWY
jgi:hypothetical protein